MQTGNRPHYHVWRKARTGRIFYMLKRGFHTRQACRQWAIRQDAGKGEFMVLECSDRKCRPSLD